MTQVELQQIGPYPVQQIVRTGPTSTYYLSTPDKPSRKKPLLIKLFQQPLPSEAQAAFIARATSLKKLSHRAIVPIKDVGIHEEHGYLVMEHVQGEPLSVAYAMQPNAPEIVRQIFASIADALQSAHVRNILHNNLHPAVILAGTRAEYLLTDFSLSSPQLGLPLDDETSAIPYMAPEHLRGQPTTASDQYALAAMSYEWLCGRRPYQASTRDLLLEQQTTPLPALRTFNATLSTDIEHVIIKALSYNADERFPHMQAFANAYLRALLHLPVNTSPSQPPTNTPHPPIVAASPRPRVEAISSQPPAITKVEVSPSRTPTNSNDTAATGQDMPPLSLEKDDTVVPTTDKHDTSVPTTDKHDTSVPTEAIKGALQAQIVKDLGQGGVLSQKLDGYEERPAQTEMAILVARALTEGVPAIIEAGTGTGKALDVDTPIPTPNGWKRIGDLRTGDFVFDEQGYPTRVSVAFDIMHNHTCYEVVFSDGSSIVADAEHEWVSYTCADRKNAYLSVDETTTLIGEHRWSVYQAAVTMTSTSLKERPAHDSKQTLLTAVRECLATDLSEQRRDGRAYTLVTTEQMAATLTVGTQRRANHAIPVAGPLVLPEVILPIKPYFLGIWLGDGTSHHNQITIADPELITALEKDGYTVRSLQSHPYLYAVDDENGKAVSRWQAGMTGRLRTLGVYRNKHIPLLYLRASEQQRRALLAGLLDTDGTVNSHGAAEFTTTSQQLAQDVYELVCSLGFRSSLRQGRVQIGEKDCGPKWTIAFTTDQQVFHLPRKMMAHKEQLRNYSADRNKFRYVVAVREVDSRPVRCIQVEAASHLYLAGRSMIPTHNSLAYLVPIVRSGKVAIVSTANKALQEQLFYKDIPFVQRNIKHFEAALVKGVNNYVCLDRVEAERVGMQFYTKNTEFRHLLEIINNPDSTFSGDFETLGFQLPSDIRGRVATDSDQCAWSKCSFFGECYVRQMRANATKAQVIVVNHTLLLLDAAIGGFLLPERDIIVIDEAHHLEEEATRSFTTTIGPMQIQLLLAQRMLKTHSQMSLQAEAERSAFQTWQRLSEVADPGYKGRINLEEPLQEGLHLASALSDVADSMRKQRPKDLTEKDDQLYDKLLKRIQNLAEGVRAVFSVTDPQHYVYYVERTQTAGQRGFHLQVSAAPLDVTTFLKERLFEKSNVVCTSATLATIGPSTTHPEEKGPNFAYYRRRIGLDQAERDDVLERILPLTFDYERNALLYLPRDLPPPTFGTGSDDYMKAIAREMYRLVKLSRGRAFLLFSSKRMLERAYELMAPHLTYPLLKQGDMTRMELTRRFRAEEGAVLFGLKSFWEGVDIAGDALSLVVIDKLPFDPPDDPVHEARVAQMKAAGENWFGIYVLPQAVLRLKQGIGRLLRSHEDRGVMAILDTRLYSKGYGKLVLDALPPAHRTSTIREVENFFRTE